MATSDQARVSAATREAERKDAHKEADPGRPPTLEEDAVADAHGEADPEVAAANKEAVERGAAHPGEGRIP